MKTRTFLFYLLAILLGGCLPVMSLHPLFNFNEKDVVFDEKLLGTWVDDPNSPETTWEFKRADANENAYRLIYSDKEKEVEHYGYVVVEGGKGLFIAHLVKLKDKLFLDAFPDRLPYYEPRDPNEKGWAYSSLFLLPTHTFIKVDAIGSQLILRVTDDEKFKKLLAEDTNAVIKHTLLDDKPILTASTEDLQEFILKYADDSRVFTDAIVLDRKKTAEPNAPAGSKPGKSPK